MCHERHAAVRTTCGGIRAQEIRKLFMERITQAKGLDGLSGLVPVILPTPMAALQGALLGAQGTENETGWGDMLVVDVEARPPMSTPSVMDKLRARRSLSRACRTFSEANCRGRLGHSFQRGDTSQRVGIDDFEKEFRAGFPGAQRVCRGNCAIYRADQSINFPGSGRRVAERGGCTAGARRRGTCRGTHVGGRQRIVTREGEAWVDDGKDLSETRTPHRHPAVCSFTIPISLISLSQAAAGDYRYDVLRPKNPYPLY